MVGPGIGRFFFRDNTSAFSHPCLLEGACGITTTNDELVVGVDAAYFDSYP